MQRPVRVLRLLADGPSARDAELASFADAARFFNPLMITFTGGEPTLRRDLEDLVRAVAQAVRLKYITMITHGGMLTPERAVSLWDAGINQFNISLDYLDGRHDAARGIPGLTNRIFGTVDGMRSRGIDSIRFNTVIRADNLDQLLPIVHRAAETGVRREFQPVYRRQEREPRPAGGRGPRGGVAVGHRRAAGLQAPAARRDHQLRPLSRQIPRYVRGEAREPCQSGIRTIHIDPTGRVKRCPDFPTDFHWTDFREYQPIACHACFYACRGEAQAPMQWSRVLDVMA